MRIVRLDEAGGAERWRARIEAIFWANAGTKAFASAGDRDAYCELWLGRYLRHGADACFIALDGAGSPPQGYLAGSLVSNRAPLPGPDYYDQFPPALTDAMPAHIHVNIREGVRGQRIGSRLVAAFRELCLERAVPGMHAVTAADSRAARFFMRCGLAEQAVAEWRSRHLVFLGEPLL